MGYFTPLWGTFWARPVWALCSILGGRAGNTVMAHAATQPKYRCTASRGLVTAADAGVTPLWTLGEKEGENKHPPLGGENESFVRIEMSA